MLKDIPPNERENYNSLFQAHRHMRATLNSILKYGIGDLYVGERADFAVASVEACTYFAGHTLNAEEILSVLKTLRNPYRFLFDGDHWKDVLLKNYGNKATVKVREAFSAAFLNFEKLKILEKKVPFGFQLFPIDKSLALRCDPKVFPLIQRNLGSFGYGFALLKGNEIVSVATAADICDDIVEVQINTHHQFRQQGAATVTAAAFINQCLINGYSLEWDATDEISSSLAKKLGFVSCGKYEVVNLKAMD